MSDKSTIASLQTPPGRGGIAVIILAGDKTDAILAELFKPMRKHKVGGSGKLQLGHITSPNGIIDEAIICQRTDRAEINIHGGPAATKAVIAELARLGAEIIPPSPMISDNFQLAHTDYNNPAIGAEMLEALPSLRGLLPAAAITNQWSAGISALAANPDSSADELRAAADGLTVMKKLKTPAEIALAGPPNAGKSTLANFLVGRQVSISHAQAGTTRDWVRELALIGGLPVYITDTAGIWDAPDHIDIEAINRAHSRLEQAELVLLLLSETSAELPSWPHAPKTINVWTKRDIHQPPEDALLAISALTGEGMDALGELILENLGLAGFDPTQGRAFTDRQATLLNKAAGAKESGDQAAVISALEELLTGEI